MPAGRPTVVTDEVLRKLEQAYAMDCTDGEACLFADIAMSTLYKYQSENPEFTDRKKELKNRPVLKARTTVVNNLDDPEMAFKYLEKKKKDEFSSKTEQELYGKNGKDLIPSPLLKNVRDNNSITESNANERQDQSGARRDISIEDD